MNINKSRTVSECVDLILNCVNNGILHSPTNGYIVCIVDADNAEDDCVPMLELWPISVAAKDLASNPEAQKLLEEELTWSEYSLQA